LTSADRKKIILKRFFDLICHCMAAKLMGKNWPAQFLFDGGVHVGKVATQKACICADDDSLLCSKALHGCVFVMW